MSVLHVLVTAAPAATDVVPWALHDDQGRIVRSGTSLPQDLPAGGRRVAVLAARAVRLVRVILPPMPADRVPAAAAYALEDKLAGPAQAQHLVASPRERDGSVDVAVAARDLFAPLARDYARVVAEPALAPVPPADAWRWYASAAGGGFVRRGDGSALSVAAPDSDAALPAELSLAVTQAARAGAAPARIEVAFPATDAALDAWSREGGLPFQRAAAWRWDQDADALARAPNLLQGDFGATPASAAPGGARAFQAAACVALAAVGLHVVASTTQWAMLRFDSWQTQRAIVTTARDAGLADASTSDSAAASLRERFVQARHRAGRAAPADALPLLARAAPTLSTLPPTTLKSATYAAGTWTLDLARLDAAAATRLERELAAAGLTVIAAPNANGLRMRIAPLAGTELP